MTRGSGAVGHPDASIVRTRVASVSRRSRSAVSASVGAPREGFFPASGFWGAIPRSPLHDVSNRLAHALTSNLRTPRSTGIKKPKKHAKTSTKGMDPKFLRNQRYCKKHQNGGRSKLGLKLQWWVLRARARARVGKIWGYLAASFANISFLFKIDPLPSSRADALREVPSGGTPKEHRNSRTFFPASMALFYPSPFARFPRRRGYDFIGSRFSYTRYVHG